MAVGGWATRSLRRVVHLSTAYLVRRLSLVFLIKEIGTPETEVQGVVSSALEYDTM